MAGIEESALASTKLFELTLQRWKLMQAIVRKPKDKVRLSPNWRAISREFDLGDIDGANKLVYFSSDELSELRQLIKLRYGLDLLLDDIDGSRIEIAIKSHKEKLAPITPEANHVLCRWPNSHTLSKLLPDSASLRLPVEHVLAELAKADCLVDVVLVVENLDVFDQLNRVKLPDILTNGLVMYRGSHIHSPAAIKRFLNELPSEVVVCAFTDMDPAGLDIALSLGAEYWLLPYDLEKLLTIKQINDAEDFAKQHKQASHLDSSVHQGELSAVTAPIWLWMRQHHISIKQQHMLAHDLPLKLYKQKNSCPS